MRTRWASIVVTVLALLFGSADLRGEEARKDSTLADLVLGDYWHGAQVSKADLEGKVVLFVLWGS